MNLISIIIDFMAESMHSFFFFKHSHFIQLSSQMEIIASENHAQTKTIVRRTAILHIAGQALCARLPTNFKRELDASLKRTTVRRIPITSCVSTIYMMRFITVAYITIPIIYFDFSMHRSSRNVSRAIRLAPYFLRMKFSHVYGIYIYDRVCI